MSEKQLIKKIVPMLSKERTCQCQDALRYAIITDKKLIPDSVKKKLDIIIGKYITLVRGPASAIS